MTALLRISRHLINIIALLNIFIATSNMPPKGIILIKNLSFYSPARRCINIISQRDRLY